MRMRLHLRVDLAGLLALLCVVGVARAVFLDEAKLAELAEHEGYQLTLHEVQRIRRQAEECRCPPGPPPPPGSWEDGERPPPPPPPNGCFPPPPPPGSWHHRRWGSAEEGRASCELRPLFRMPDKFNFTARITCFERWEREEAKNLGVTPEDRFDMSKYKPTQHRALMWNKGCDMQCHFSELSLLSAEDDEQSVDAEAVASLLKEEGDSSDITEAVDKALEGCRASASEMLHAKQVCRSGADELLFCLQRTIEQICPGAKWQGQRSCDEVADAPSKLLACRMNRHHGPHGPHRGPHGPWGPFGPPPPPPPHHGRGRRPYGARPAVPPMPNTLTPSMGGSEDASQA